ncbi:MAG TPA: hypothetical protein VIG94_11255 [Faecalibacter sp.]
MKKTILRLMFAAALTATFTGVTSCSSDDAEEFSISDQKHFNPPTWIQGKWGNEFDEGNEYLYEFKADNFIIKISNGSQDYNALINLANAGGMNTMSVVEEVKTSTRYKFIIKTIGGMDTTHDFQLQSDGSMKDMESGLSGWVYTKRP